MIGRSWDNVVDAIDEIITTPDVDEAASEKAEAELAEPAPEPEEVEEVDETEADDVVIDDVVDTDEEADALAAHAAGPGAGQRRGLLAQGRHRSRADDDQRRHVLHAAVLPRRPADLPGPQRPGQRIQLERTLARYLADEHDHDLSDLATYDDIRTAATDGSLQVNVTDDNVYVLTGLADDLADGPDAIDRDQLELAVELLRDVGEYAEDTIVDEALDADQPLGRLVAHVLDPDTVQPAEPAVRQGRRAVGGAGGLRRVAAAPGVALQLRCLRMPWLVEAEVAAAWQLDAGQQAPALIGDRAAADAFGHELFDRGGHVVAHQIQLVRRRVRGVDRHLAGRQLEDQPAAARVDVRVLQHVAEERPVGVGVAAVHDHMSAGDHALTIRRDEFAAPPRSAPV